MTQHQGSLKEQLQELVFLANREGLYDAADFVTRALENFVTKENFMIKYETTKPHYPKIPPRKYEE